MLFCEQTQQSLAELLEKMRFDYIFKIHGCYRYPVYPGWKSGIQNYKDLHLLYVWGGEGIYHMSDGKSIPLSNGSLIYVSHGYNHTVSHNLDNPVRIQGIRFGIYDKRGQDMTRKIVEPCYFYMKPTDIHYFDSITHKLHRIFHSPKKPVHEGVCAALVFQILSEMYLNLTEKSLCTNKMNAIDQARELIEESVYSKKSIQEIADELGMSIRYLQKKFKEQIGYTPKEYQIHVQMNTAYELFAKENTSVKRIAQMLGYSDQYAFSHQFKKYFGFSPTKVRT